MGESWPLSYRTDGSEELVELIEGMRRRADKPPQPTRRERWARDDHEPVPTAELERLDREAAELLADLEAKNARIEAQLRAGHIDRTPREGEIA